MMSKWATKWGVEHQLVVSPKNWGFQDLLSLCASCKFSRLAGSLHRGSWKWMFFRVQAERVSKWWFVVTFSQKYEIIFIWCLYMPSTSTLLMIALDQPRHPANEQLFSTRHATWDMCQMASRENRSKLEFLQDDMLAQQASSPMMASLVFFLCQHGTSRRSLQRKGTKIEDEHLEKFWEAEQRQIPKPMLLAASYGHVRVCTLWIFWMMTFQAFLS